MRDYTLQTIQTYDATAKEYAKQVANIAPGRIIERFLPCIPDNSKLLDLGCGSGRDAQIFTEKGHNVIGVDLSEELIKICRKSNPKLTFQVMDMLDIDFLDSEFDGVWSMGSILHIAKNDIPSVFSQVYRVLKQGGVFGLSVKEGESEGYIADNRYDGKKKYYSLFQLEELETLLLNAGFKTAETERILPTYEYNTNCWLQCLAKK